MDTSLWFKNNSDRDKDELLIAVESCIANLKNESENFNLPNQIALMYWQLCDTEYADRPSKYGADIVRFAKKAYTYFEFSAKHHPGTLDTLIRFSAFLEYYANRVDDSDAVDDLEKALKLLQTADEITPGNVEIHYQMGRKHLVKFPFSTDRQESLLKAIEEFNLALMIDPAHLNSLINKAAAYVKLGWACNYNSQVNYQTAIDISNKAIEIDPENTEAHRNKAAACIELYQLTNDNNDIEKAKLHLDTAISLEKGSVDDLIEMYENLKANSACSTERFPD